MKHTFSLLPPALATSKFVGPLSVFKLKDLNKVSFIDISKSLILKSVSSLPNIEVDSFDGLMVEHASKHGAIAAIRGLRALSDFEFEFKMALMNRNLNDNVSTLFLTPHAKYTHVSSSMVKEVASLGGCVSDYVPSHVDQALRTKYGIK